MTNANTLADRVEGAEGPSYALDCEIARAINPQATSQTVPPAYSASLDAAMTLVPEGWQCGFEMHGCYDQVDRPEAWCWPYSSDFEPDWRDGNEGYRSNPHGYRAVAATPALALVAAALRARNGSNTDV